MDDAAFGVRLASPHSQTSQVKKRMPSIRGIPWEFGNLAIKETNCTNPRKWKLCFLMIRYDKYCMRMRLCARLPVTCCTIWSAKGQWKLKPVKFPSTQMYWSCWFGQDEVTRCFLQTHILNVVSSPDFGDLLAFKDVHLDASSIDACCLSDLFYSPILCSSFLFTTCMSQPTASRKETPLYSPPQIYSHRLGGDPVQWLVRALRALKVRGWSSQERGFRNLLNISRVEPIKCEWLWVVLNFPLQSSEVLG